ncbi:MAG: carboxypeptidase-like regulatory domain-containing protein, partial [Rubricoccaceae bacterium]|nr:carboxypeptidase-like regulatory domain-containing protein [Rubricoccaceae bacterium]
MPVPRLLVACLLVLSGAAAAQPVALEGRVLDTETAEPLAGATAQALGGAGAVADAEGRFRLPLPALPAAVVVRFVGYQADTLRLSGPGPFRRTIRLVPVPAPLGEVTVTDENAAVGILRRVLARKASLRRRVPAYGAEGYARLTLRRVPYGVSEGTVARLEEALTNVFWRATGGGREEVVARRRVPDGGPFRYVGLDAVPDLFFDDTVVLDGTRYPTPTHPDALALYDVRLGAITEADGLRFYDIALAPRGARGLQGRIRVVDSLFVLAEAELRTVGSGRRSLVTAFDAT